MNVDAPLQSLAAAIVTVGGGWWGKLSDNWRALLVIAAAVAVGWTAARMYEDVTGRGSRITENAEEVDALDTRVDRLETWRVFHEDSVTTPGQREMAEVVARTDSLYREIRMIRAMTYQMYCDRWPDRCEAVPPGAGGGNDP